MIKKLKREILSAHLVSFATKVPILSTLLRHLARRFEEGSIVKISRGMAVGMLWKRYHRNVNAYWLGNYELPVQRRIALELNDGDTFFDIGANAGFFSLVAAKVVGKTGRVVAFEPVPVSAMVVREQFEINNLAQCTCVESAVGGSVGERVIVIPQGEDMKASLPKASLKEVDGEVHGEKPEGSFLVEVTTLDSFVESEGVAPNLVKIDVEGGEAEVLAGGSGLINSGKAPRIIVETHGQETVNFIEKNLRSAGYRFFDMRGKPLQSLFAERHLLAYPPRFAEEPHPL